jgi:hypothetical protein
MEGVADELAVPPVNVYRISLHPRGLASRIVNFTAWRAHLLQRLARQVEVSGDAQLAALLEEVRDYPEPEAETGATIEADFEPFDTAGIVVPLHLTTRAGTLSFFSTTTIFGSPVDVTLAELAIESFFPADAQTAAMLERMAAGLGTKTS